MSDPAPLISIPEAPAPSDARPSWHLARDGVRLRVVLFPSPDRCRGTVVLSPGRTEPIEKYFEVIGELQSRGFSVLSHDWRGQGLSDRLVPSDRLKGHASGWRGFVQDYTDILTAHADDMPTPWIAMGHSMGGGLTALALGEGEDRFAAAILSAPMVGINTGGQNPLIVRITAALMRLVGKGSTYALPPVEPFAETFKTTVLTHDEARWALTRRQYEAHPDLVLGGVTWGWIDFAVRLTSRIANSRRIDQLPIPLMIIAGSEEKLVRNADAEAVARRAPKGRFVMVDGAYHEILMETDPRRAIFWAEFDALAAEVAPA